MAIDWSSFNSIPVWAKVMDIDPIFLSSKHMLGVIGNMIGKPISVDSITIEVDKISFARFLVGVTLVETRRTEVLLESYNGTLYKHRVEFEWLPWSCGICSTFGHTDPFFMQNAHERKLPREVRTKVGHPMVPNSYLEVANANPPNVDSMSLHQPVREQKGKGKEKMKRVEKVSPDFEEPILKSSMELWPSSKIQEKKVNSTSPHPKLDKGKHVVHGRPNGHTKVLVQGDKGWEIPKHRSRCPTLAISIGLTISSGPDGGLNLFHALKGVG